MSERKLWLLRPVGFDDPREYHLGGPWQDDCLHGVIVSAESEAQARLIAEDQAGGEDKIHTGKWPPLSREPSVWQDPEQTTCQELKAEDFDGLVMRDFYSP